MRVIFDNRFYYSPQEHIKAACHLKILTANSNVLVLVTEVQDNLDWSIARSPETLAMQIVNMFQLNPDIIRYIEYFPAQEKKKRNQENALVRSIEAYFLVDFIWRTTNGTLPPYKAIHSQRTPLSLVEYVRLMRATIYATNQNSR